MPLRVSPHHFACGTKPFDGYPTADTYFAQFTPETACDHWGKDIYYDHLPIHTGGNVYFNGAEPCDHEENFKKDTEHTVTLSLKEENGHYKLETNVYDFISEPEAPIIGTETLGMAFEPEQKFEAPDGTPIIFNRDYFAKERDIMTLPGPFACGCEASDILA